ncbi:hypothetical protein M1105_01530 [Limibaculum sp. FT325]|uniref:hypothetical protein n=1 Tax=Thermohalobaculum sediminis TaxID=2939436 RepID=UPI0020BDB65B|nr:hypothetical protein [Limibaculum sediminis]MCL5775677.1 hypothetical protein [Limibaculum sediminis]
MQAFRFMGPLALAALLGAGPAAADEIEDALAAALEAYRAGDLAVAKEEIDFAATLIAQQKAAGLEAFLPEPLEGWTRLETSSNAGAAGMFGGGLMATAEYQRDRETVAIQLMADNQMVAAMGAMLSNPQMMAQMGKVERIDRQMVVVTNAGEVQTLLDNRILVQISGSAPAETKLDYFRVIDIDGLKDF